MTENGSEINKKLFTTPNKTNRKSINQNYKLTNIPENSINDSKINNQNSYLDIAKKIYPKQILLIFLQMKLQLINHLMKVKMLLII